MSAGTTQYSVEIDYRLAGVEKAIAGMKGGEAAANRMAKALESVKRIALTIGASFVFGKIKHALIDSNAELDGMNRNMTTMMAVNLGVPFERAEPIAKRFVEHFQGVKGDLGEFLGIANKIGPAVLAGGGSVGELKKLVEGVSVAGKALGGGMAAKGLLGDVGQAVSSKAGVSAESSPMLANLLGSEKAILEFNKSSAQKRVEILTRAFESPAIKESARRFGESYEGQLGSLKDTAASTFRAIGAPLFRQLTSWIKQINAWTDRNAAKLSSMAHDVGDALATGARWLVKAGSFIVDNKATFLALAAGLAVGKGLGGLAFAGPGAGALSGFAKLASNANLAALALGGLAAGIAFVVSRKDSWGNQTTREIEAHFASKAAGEMVAGVLINKRQVDYGQGGNAVLMGLQKLGGLKQAWDEENLRKKDAVKPRNPKVNVTIKRVEVVADDADRFIHSLNRAVGKELASPSQSVFMPRGNV